LASRDNIRNSVDDNSNNTFMFNLHKIITILIIFTAIEFNLQWLNNEHQPNWVEVKNDEEVVEVNDSWEKVNEVYYWNIYDLEGNLITFLNFWTE